MEQIQSDLLRDRDIATSALFFTSRQHRLWRRGACAIMLGRCLAVFATTHLLSVGTLTALLLLLQHALRNSSTAPTISTPDTISFVHVVNVFSLLS